MANKYVTPRRLSTFLENLKNIFASITHKHILSDITDYEVDTALSSTSTNPVANKVIDAEFDAISDAIGVLDLAIDDKADKDHNHDDKYCTTEEVNVKFSEVAYIDEDDDIKEVINTDLCGVFYGGFMQNNILKFFNNNFDNEPLTTQNQIVEKLVDFIENYDIGTEGSYNLYSKLIKFLEYSSLILNSFERASKISIIIFLFCFLPLFKLFYYIKF